MIRSEGCNLSGSRETLQTHWGSGQARGLRYAEESHLFCHASLEGFPTNGFAFGIQNIVILLEQSLWLMVGISYHMSLGF